MSNAAVEAAGPRIETFLVPMGRYLGYFVVAVAVVLSILGLAGGGGDFGLVEFAVALALVAWIALIRPQVEAHRNGLLMRNMLRDVFVPWASIRSCRAAQTLQVGTRDKIYHGLGVSKSARQSVREGRQAKRQLIGPNVGVGRLEFAHLPDPNADPESKTDVHQIMQQHVVKNNFSHIEERVEYFAAERSKATAGQSPKIVWSLLPIAALVLALVALVGAFV